MMAMNNDDILAEQWDTAEIEKELWPVAGRDHDLKEFEEELLNLGIRFE